MRISIISFVGVLMVIGILNSCKKAPDTSQLYIPTASDTTATASLEDLQQGRELYINNCGECHAYAIPDDYSVSKWNNILQQMAPKTSMNTQQIDLVKKYVTRGQQ